LRWAQCADRDYSDRLEPTKIGVSRAISLPVSERADADREEYIEQFNGATGIFMTGGNQLRLSTILGGTLMAQKIRRLNAAGVHVAGTSAGAAIMPEHMIAGGSMGLSPQADGVNLAPGLGLTNAVIIDQHFSQRDRLGRLLTAVSYNPFLLGVGIDEDTAIFIAPDRVFEVEGSATHPWIGPRKMSLSACSISSCIYYPKAVVSISTSVNPTHQKNREVADENYRNQRLRRA
jgi:cyanophycinase